MLVFAFTGGTAFAQTAFYAATNGDKSAGNPCTDPNDACSLQRAFDAAGTSAGFDVVYAKIPQDGGSTIFTDDPANPGLFVPEDIAIGVYTSPGVQNPVDPNNPFAGASDITGVVTIEDNVIIGSDGTTDGFIAGLFAPQGIEIQYGGNEEIRLAGAAPYLGGPGLHSLVTATGFHSFVMEEGFLASAPTPVFLTDNLRIAKPGGGANFEVDGSATTTPDEVLFQVFNALSVESNSTLNLGSQEFVSLVIAPFGFVTEPLQTGVQIASGASIQGGGTFITSSPFGTDPANDLNVSAIEGLISGGLALGVTGQGALNMELQAAGGTTVYTLGTLGGGGDSFFDDGRTYVTQATTFDGDLFYRGGTGTFSGGSELYFYNLSTVTGRVVGSDFDGDNTSNTYLTFFTPVTIEGGVDLSGIPGSPPVPPPTGAVSNFTDRSGWLDTAAASKVAQAPYDAGTYDTCLDPNQYTTGCGDVVNPTDIDDVDSDGNSTETLTGGPVLTFSAGLVPNGVTGASTIPPALGTGNLVSISADGATRINLDAASNNRYHNLDVEGNFSFGYSPAFYLQSPAPVGTDDLDICAADYAATLPYIGNKVTLTSAQNQELLYNTLLQIEALAVDKASTSNTVTIDQDISAILRVDNSLEVFKGRFITNGLLDAGDDVTGERAVVTINWDGDGLGILDAGNSARAYISDATTDTPGKVRYTGNVGIFTADEIPGPRAGSEAGTEIILQEVEVAMESNSPVITLGKSFSISNELRLTRGNLDVGSANVTLFNGVQIAMGDGEIRRSGTPPFFGNLIFPTEDTPSAGTLGGGFSVSNDGVDLLYFGTMDRVVSLEWPSDASQFVTAPLNVVRDVTVDAACDDDIVVSLREDEVFQINQDTRADQGTLDIVGNTLQINAVNGVNTLVYADTNGDIWDSAFYGAAKANSDLNVAELGTQIASLKGERDSEGAVDEAAYQDAVDNIKALTSSVDTPTAAKSEQLDIGLVLFIGNMLTDVVLETVKGTQLDRQFPAWEVNRTGNGPRRVTFNSDGNELLAQGETITPLDRVFFPTGTITAANDGNSTGADNGGAGVAFCTGWDVVDTSGDYNQFAGEAKLAVPCGYENGETAQNSTQLPTGATDFTPDGGFWFQQFLVGSQSFTIDMPGNHTQEDGEFYGNGADETVFGDFQLGLTDGGSTALWNGAPYTFHIQIGNWFVGEDMEDTPGPYLGSPCVVAGVPNCGFESADNDVTRRNQYAQGGFETGATLFMFGPNWNMQGTFDVFADAFVPGIQQGADGLIVYAGPLLQSVTQRQDEDAFVRKVLLAEDPGIEIQTSFWGNLFSTFWMELGNINSPDSNVPGGDPENELIILNPLFEGLPSANGLAGRNDVPDQWLTGFADGARDSYVAVNTPIRRLVSEGQATGGDVGNGYFFTHGFQVDQAAGKQSREFFTPHILEFANDQGEGLFAKSTIITPNDPRPDLEFTPFRVDAAGPGQTVLSDDLLINTTSDLFYRVEFFNDVFADESTGGGPNADIPSEDPNIRISADGLPGTSRLGIDRVRILHWDCEGNFLGLAGVYDLFADQIDDTSQRNNDFINGIPNMIQEGVNVRSCNIFGLGANAFENPIDGQWGGGEFNEDVARIQVIHDSPDAPAVDVYIDGTYAATVEFENDGDATPKATGFGAVIAGEREVAIVPAGGELGDAVFTTTVSVTQNENYVVFASGLLGDDSFTLDVIGDARVEASNDEVISALFQHNAPNAPSPVDIRGLNPFDSNNANRIFANNLSYLDNTGYTSLDPQSYSIELSTADNATVAGVYFFELDSYAGQALSCFASNTDLDGSGVAILCATATGQIIEPDVVTSDENPTELPTEFALDGNYPNPFNPSTTIQFDLPETAEVSVEIVDMLGRQVMTVPAQTMQAGADRQIQVNASNLASGVYVYRLVVKTSDSNPEFKTGRMTLIK
jgi:hypothetical protein